MVPYDFHSHAMGVNQPRLLAACTAGYGRCQVDWSLCPFFECCGSLRFSRFSHAFVEFQVHKYVSISPSRQIILLGPVCKFVWDARGRGGRGEEGRRAGRGRKLNLLLYVLEQLVALVRFCSVRPGLVLYSTVYRYSFSGYRSCSHLEVCSREIGGEAAFCICIYTFEASMPLFGEYHRFQSPQPDGASA